LTLVELQINKGLSLGRKKLLGAKRFHDVIVGPRVKGKDVRRFYDSAPRTWQDGA
jgi:hypothetical protein